MEGIVFKRIEPEEQEELESFLQKTFPQWQGIAGRAQGGKTPPIHIAKAEGIVVGFASSWRGEFGPIGVEPDYRLRGIVKVLLLQSLKDIKKRGYRKASIGWANFPFYARAISARLVRVMWQMEKKID